MARRVYALLLPALLLLPLPGARRGGWATITVEEVPDFVQAGTALPLTFMVRQHGVTPLQGLHPVIEARAGTLTARADAEAGRQTGRYSGSIVLPEPGDWVITIQSGFGNSKLALLPIRVTPTAAAAPPPLPESERGRRTFVSKGCVGCHTRGDVDVGAGAAIAPVLTGKRYAAEWLRRFLADPAANATHSGTFRMPNLGLRPAEIGAPVEFLNADRAGSR